MKSLIEGYPVLCECIADIEKATDLIITAYKNGGKLLLCGNGGSSADCDHISGELLKGFLKKRSISPDEAAAMKSNCPDLSDAVIENLQGGLPAISLPSLTAFNTAFLNDCNPELLYAQGVNALGAAGDILVAISTSGNSQNVVYASQVARAKGLKVISLTGAGGGKLKTYSDVCICVPESETYKVQELHLPVYHCICRLTEEYFWAK